MSCGCSMSLWMMANSSPPTRATVSVSRAACRSRSATSSREVVVQLSSKGRTLVRRLIPVALRLERDAAAGIAPKQLQAMKAALRAVYRNLARA